MPPTCAWSIWTTRPCGTDEAPAALIGRNLLQRGDITGWDGRNLVGGTNGRTLNDQLRDVLPPLTYVINAAGMAVFGVNETGARIMPALLGIATLGLLWLLLRQHLPEHPRLVFWCLLFAAWSPQLLLFFRQSRYFAFLAFALIAAFYLYERWWRSGKAGYLGALTLVAALAFFNHYVGGAATMLALAAWHLLFRARATAPRQWLALAGSGLVVVALGTAYLAWLGVLGGERSGFLAFTGVPGIGEYRGTAPLVLLRIGIYLRELFTADWISWPVALWFAGMLALPWLRRWRDRQRLQPDAGARSRRQRGTAQVTAPEDPSAEGAAEALHRRPATERDEHGEPQLIMALPLAAAGAVVLMGALFALCSAVLSVQPVWVNPTADLRYYMAALPLLLAMKGLFAEWAWRRSRPAGAAAIAVLLFSSAGAWPFNVTNFFSDKPTLGLHLFQFVREIHRPYRDSIRVVSDYLLEHAEQDDLVYVPWFADREALTFTVGHRVLLCCGLKPGLAAAARHGGGAGRTALLRAARCRLDRHLRGIERRVLGVVKAALYGGRTTGRVLLSDAAAGDQHARFCAAARGFGPVGRGRRVHPAAQGQRQVVPGGRNPHAPAALPGGAGGVPRGSGARPRPRARPCRRGRGAVSNCKRYEEALAALAHALAMRPDAPYAGRLQAPHGPRGAAARAPRGGGGPLRARAAA